MKPSVLVIQHTPVCPPARVGDWLEAAGVSLDVRVCPAGDPLPGDLSGHDGLLVLGGEMGAYDDERYPWLTTTKGLLSEAVRRDLPTLGICLGLQLLAVAEGGAVAPAAAGPQVGLHPVRLTPAAAEDLLFGGLDATTVAAHWNNDVVTRPPAGAVPLAWSEAGLQAFRLQSRVWAVQFHPEVTLDILRLWAAADVDAGLLTAELTQRRLAAVEAADPQLVTTWRAVAERFAAVVASPVSAGVRQAQV